MQKKKKVKKSGRKSKSKRRSIYLKIMPRRYRAVDPRWLIEIKSFKGLQAIFLDIDGVFNGGQHGVRVNRRREYDPYRDEACPVALSNMMMILEQVPNAVIVISSTWRKGRSITSLRKLFKGWGMQKWTRIVGKTPTIISRKNREWIRGKEIKWYCDKYKIKKYAIIDDDSDMLKQQRRRFVQIDNWHGMMYRDALRVMAILGWKRWLR